MRPEFTPSFLARFWSRVEKSGECWIWRGGFYSNGYGRIYIKKQDFGAHRVSWEVCHGDVPGYLWVLHNCPGGDNRACVNPAHLFLGTNADNQRDLLSKGGSTEPHNRACGDRSGSRLHPELFQGERNGRAKLTAQQVAEIRRIYAEGGISQLRLGLMFGVSESLVRNIIIYKRWKEVA